MKEFDDLGELDKCSALAATLEAIAPDECHSIQEWARRQKISPQRAWERILTAKGLPLSQIPSRLLVSLTEKG
ncbi:MAG: hypothetical protein ACLQJR_32125 [Stellaceae bacterium]